MSTSLVDMNLKICANDYYFHESFGQVILVNEVASACLIKLNSPHVDEEKVYQHVLCFSRSAGSVLGELLVADCADVSAFWITHQKLAKAKNFDATWWRGGAASRVTLIRYDPELSSTSL